jgi:hypothetical protein
VLRRVRSWWNFRRAVRDASRLELTHPAGARDIVVLPCWRRPEFLWHCLDNLTRTDGFDQLHLLFRPDTGFSQENIEVIHSFADRLPSFQISLPDPCPFRRTKQSANLLLGYLRAAAEALRYVFLVEEDTMVARDFFRWHRAVHAAADPLYCSIASRNPNRVVTVPDDPQGYYLTSGDFCSGGVCFDKHRLQTLVAPHVNMAYFRRPKKYLRRQFPGSAVGLGFVEQDGLLRRIQERAGMRIAYPCVARCYNAGFYGYNRPGGLAGSVDDRVRRLATTIYSTEAMRAAAASGFSEIYLPVSLQPRHWQVQRCIDVDLGPAAEPALTPGSLH